MTLQAVAEREQRVPAKYSFTAPHTDLVPYDVMFEAPGEHNWSFTHLYENKGEGVTRDMVETFKKRLGHALAVQNIRTAFAPTVRHMSGVILPAEKFTEHVPLSCGVMILRPTVPCDAVPLERLASGVMGQGGCPLLVLTGMGTNGPFCFFAHAGKESLVDKLVVLEKGRRRRDFSIVDALVRYAKSLGAQPSGLTLRIFGGKPWEAYPHYPKHPKHGAYNYELIKFLYHRHGGSMIKMLDGIEHLCVSTLAELQADGAGIGTIQTPWVLPFNGDFPYTSRTDQRFNDTSRSLVTLTRR